MSKLCATSTAPVIVNILFEQQALAKLTGSLCDEAGRKEEQCNEVIQF